MVSAIYEDVRLPDTRYFCVKAGLLLTTYPFEITMNHAAGVEKLKAFSDIT